MFGPITFTRQKSRGSRQNPGGNIHQWNHKLRHEVRWLRQKIDQLRDDLDDERWKNETLRQKITDDEGLLDHLDYRLNAFDEELDKKNAKIQRLQNELKTFTDRKKQESKSDSHCESHWSVSLRASINNDCFICSLCFCEKNTSERMLFMPCLHGACKDCTTYGLQYEGCQWLAIFAQAILRVLLHNFDLNFSEESLISSGINNVTLQVVFIAFYKIYSHVSCSSRWKSSGYEK